MTKIIFNDFSKLWLESYAIDNVKPSTLSGYNYTIERGYIRINPCEHMERPKARALHFIKMNFQKT
jgi:hypothetical protein